MKPEPLKGKMKVGSLHPCHATIPMRAYCKKEDIRAAVEWLKNEATNKRIYWDSLAERNLLKTIDKAFEDVMKE